jgi:hypothetical protein
MNHLTGILDSEPQVLAEVSIMLSTVDKKKTKEKTC